MSRGRCLAGGAGREQKGLGTGCTDVTVFLCMRRSGPVEPARFSNRTGITISGLQKGCFYYRAWWLNRGAFHSSLFQGLSQAAENFFVPPALSLKSLAWCLPPCSLRLVQEFGDVAPENIHTGCA